MTLVPRWGQAGQDGWKDGVLRGGQAQNHEMISGECIGQYLLDKHLKAFIQENLQKDYGRWGMDSVIHLKGRNGEAKGGGT